MVEAFPFDRAPRYPLHDRDAIYGERFRRRVGSLGIEEVLAAPRSPWQTPYAERLIGSIRRECLDHVIVFGRAHLVRLVRDYIGYYHADRPHLGLDKDTPDGRPIAPRLSASANVVALPRIGGLHHRYEWREAA